MPDDILYTIDVVGLYPNILHDEGLIALRKSSESREDKTISTDSLMNSPEGVLKNIFLSIRTVKGTKMVPPYAVIFIGDLEERTLQDCSFRPLVSWGYTDDIFLL